MGLLILSLIFLLVGYSFQFYKLFRSKSSVGISLHTHFITVITLITLLINAQSIFVIYAVSFEFILVFILLTIIYYYKSYDLFNENKLDFSISLILSFVPINGIAQAIKSYKNKNIDSNVSILMYCNFFIFKTLLLFEAIDIQIIIATAITLVVYTYIIYKNLNI